MTKETQEFLDYAEGERQNFLIHAQMGYDSEANEAIISLYHQIAEILNEYKKTAYS